MIGSPSRGVGTPPAGHPLNWVWLTLLAVIAIEAAVAFVRPTGTFERTNFLDYRFNHPPDATRLLFDAKMREFAQSRPTILMVGDSSGFHGVHPPVVEALVPGARMVNMDIFAFGYKGYLEAARAILDRNPTVKVLVLYVTMIALPSPEMTSDTGRVGEDIAKEFNSAFHSVAHLPSLGLRRGVADVAFLGTGGTNERSVASALQKYPDALRLLPQGGGWIREHDSADDIARGPLDLARRNLELPPHLSDEDVLGVIVPTFANQPQVFDWMSMRLVGLAETTFDSIRSLAQAHGVQLVISLAPQADVFATGEIRRKIDAYNDMLRAYQARRPDVGIIPFTFWPNERYSSTEHIATPYTVENSVRLGEELRRIIGDPALVRSDRPPGEGRKRVAEVVFDVAAPVYGFAGVTQHGGRLARAIRDGRDEALVYAMTVPAMREVVVEPAPDVPEELLASVSLAAFGLACERLPDETVDGRRRMVFHLPAEAMRYDGWLELLVSTRGRLTWPGNGLDPAARGPSLALERIAFR